MSEAIWIVKWARIGGWRRRLLEIGCIGVLLAAGGICAMAEGYFATKAAGLLALFFFGLALLGVLAFSILAMVGRRWIAAVVWFVSLLGLVPGVLVGAVVAGFAGKMLASVEWEARVLPVPTEAVAEVIRSGNELVSQINNENADGAPAFALDSVDFSFGPEGRKLGFDLVLGQAAEFRAGIRFRQTASGNWEKDGNSCSGATETFEANRRRFEDAAAGLRVPDIVWPVPAEIEEQWTAAGKEIAGFLSTSGVLETSGTPWSLSRVNMSQPVDNPANSRISIEMNAKKGREQAAYATMYLTYDGKQARLEDLNAGVNRGTASTSAMEHGAEVRSLLEPWLAEKNGLIAPSKLFQSHDDSTWEACETTLPDGSVLIYRQQPAHPFLAEYNMRVEIRPPGAEKGREFFLPMNTGGRTAILVEIGKTAEGFPVVRLDAGRHFNQAFTLREPRMIPPEAVLEAAPLGAFSGVKSALRWVSATDSSDSELYEETLQYRRKY